MGQWIPLLQAFIQLLGGDKVMPHAACGDWKRSVSHGGLEKMCFALSNNYSHYN